MAERRKYKCPFCDGTSCCIKNIKLHIHERHIMYDHWAYWVHESK